MAHGSPICRLQCRTVPQKTLSRFQIRNPVKKTERPVATICHISRRILRPFSGFLVLRLGRSCFSMMYMLLKRTCTQRSMLSVPGDSFHYIDGCHVPSL
jgi:hypothetical protein